MKKYAIRSLGGAFTVLAAPMAVLASDSTPVDNLHSVEVGYSSYSGAGPVGGGDLSGLSMRGGYAFTDNFAIRGGYKSLSDDSDLDLAHLGAFFGFQNPIREGTSMYAGVTAEYLDFEYEHRRLVGQDQWGQRIYDDVTYGDDDWGFGVRVGTVERFGERVRLASEVAWVFIDDYDYYDLELTGYYEMPQVEGLDLFARGEFLDGDLGFTAGAGYRF